MKIFFPKKSLVMPFEKIAARERLNSKSKNRAFDKFHFKEKNVTTFLWEFFSFEPGPVLELDSEGI